MLSVIISRQCLVYHTSAVQCLLLRGVPRSVMIGSHAAAQNEAQSAPVPTILFTPANVPTPLRPYQTTSVRLTHP